MLRSRKGYAARAAAGALLAAAALRAAEPAPQDEALQRAFPGATIERRSVILTDAQLERVKALAGERPASPLVVAYAATRDHRTAGTAYFDVHSVRTLPQTLLWVVNPDGQIERVEVLAFREPPEYSAPARWLAQFPGRRLDDELQLKRGVHGITGATLTARSTTRSARRILALHQVLHEAAP